MLALKIPEKKNLIPEELFNTLDWQWFKNLLQAAQPLFQSDDIYVTLSNYLNAEKYMYSRTQLVEEITNRSEAEFCANYPCSFRLTNVQLLSPQVSRICLQLSQHFKKTITCNLYFTPGAERNCFDYHSDIQEIFILQLKGSKAWKFPLDENKEPIRFVKDLTFKKSDLVPGEELNVVLNQWDQLYVPYGVVHSAQVQENGPSLHLTFSTFDKPMKVITDNFFKELLHSVNMQDRQFDKLEIDEVRALVGLLKRAAFSINADELAMKIKKDTFIDDLKASKLGRPYPLQVPTKEE